MKPIPITKRRISFAVAALATAALLITLVALVSKAPADAATSAGVGTAQHQHHAADFTPEGQQQVAFHDQMRMLWEDHVTWTRLAIVTFADGSAGFNATATRLLQNQTDIGNAIKPFYGDAAGDTLSALLHDHITIAVQLLQAARAGDTAAFNAASTAWYANANDIADFLAAANPRFWPQDEMRAAMKTHLDQTLAEAAHELSADYAASVTDYEAIHLHILDMADVLSSGIIRQFENTFH